VNQPPFPKELWLIAGKHFFNAISATNRWFAMYDPSEEAQSGDFEIHIFPDKPETEAKKEDEVK
jgi:hypothetical protein